MTVQYDAEHNERLPILIVGASGVIGLSVANILSGDKYSLGLHYCNNISIVDKFIQDQQSNGVNLAPIQSNLKTIEDGEALVTNFVEKFGGIYGLVICSGLVPIKNWMDLNEEDWSEAYYQHCVLPFSLARCASTYMDNGGRVVYLSSISPKYAGSSSTLHYASAKGALEVAMTGLARELALRNILVNGVRSGFVMSPQQKQRSDEEIIKRISQIPLGRAGKAQEVASAIRYLLSKDASYITGELITVAGGD